MDIYKHKETIFLVSLMLVFTLVFFLSYQFYKTGQSIINIGINSAAIDMLVMLFSIAAIARIVFLIKSIEIKVSEQ